MRVGRRDLLVCKPNPDLDTALPRVPSVWPRRGSLMRREGEERVGVCYKVVEGTHKDRKWKAWTVYARNKKKSGKGDNRDTQTRTRIRVTRRGRGCVRKRKTIESKKLKYDCYTIWWANVWTTTRPTFKGGHHRPQQSWHCNIGCIRGGRGTGYKTLLLLSLLL